MGYAHLRDLSVRLEGERLCGRRAIESLLLERQRRKKSKEEGGKCKDMVSSTSQKIQRKRSSRSSRSLVVLGFVSTMRCVLSTVVGRVIVSSGAAAASASQSASHANKLQRHGIIAAFTTQCVASGRSISAVSGAHLQRQCYRRSFSAISSSSTTATSTCTAATLPLAVPLPSSSTSLMLVSTRHQHTSSRMSSSTARMSISSSSSASSVSESAAVTGKTSSSSTQNENNDADHYAATGEMDPVMESIFYGQRTPFKDLGLDDVLVTALSTQSMTISTAIQAMAIPSILAGDDVVIGAETGSGKTLAYLLPIIDDLMRRRTVDLPPDETMDMLMGTMGLKGWCMFPEVIILAPNRALCEQILAVTTELLANAGEADREGGIKADAVYGTSTGYPYAPQRPAPEILICTPVFLAPFGAFKRLPLFAKARAIVIDEADMLLDGGYKSQIESIMTGFRRAHRMEGVNRTQYILAAATLPTMGLKSVDKFISKAFPEATKIQADSMHKHHPGINQQFMRVDDDIDGKIDALIEVLTQPDNTGLRTMVFCNTAATCKAVNAALQDFGAKQQRKQKKRSEGGDSGGETSSNNDVRRSNSIIKAVPYHKDESPYERAENIDMFRSGEANVLVGTDLAARGLDIPAVQHIIQFEFATNVVQHLHRLGRAARAGRSGRATSFYDSAGLDLVKSIRKATDDNLTLDASFSRRRGFRQHIKKYGTAKKPASSNVVN